MPDSNQSREIRLEHHVPPERRYPDPTSTYTIREGLAADLPQVSEIKVRNWVDTYGPLLDPKVLGPFLDRQIQLEDLRQAVALPETLLLVAVDRSGSVGGFGLTYMTREPEPWLESLHVLSELRGRGIGTRLMQATAAQLVARGYDSMRLGVIAGNDAAARFYEHLGGLLIGLEPVSWAEGVMHQVYRWQTLTKLATYAGAG